MSQPSISPVKVLKRMRYVVTGALVLACLWVGYVYDTWRVPVGGTNMTPHFVEGEMVVIHTGMKEANELQRTDVVLFTGEIGGRPVRLFARVMALPGEVVEVRDGRLLVDGKAVNDPSVFSVPFGAEFSTEKAVTVPGGCVYLLNDDRSSSVPDSRALGPVDEGSVLGKVVVGLPF